MLAVASGRGVVIAVAISIDLVQYENFLLLIGGIFVPVFGVFLADYFVTTAGATTSPRPLRDRRRVYGYTAPV